jgi:hypothetical protein
MEKLKAVMTGPEPKLVEVRTEMVPEKFILLLKKKPLRRPGPLFPAKRNAPSSTSLFPEPTRAHRHDVSHREAVR